MVKAMINSKHITKITALLVCLSLLLCVGMVYVANGNTQTKVVEYESRLFGDEIISLDIRVDEADWQEILDNPTAKEYISADLMINGELFTTVGLRIKGNSSLSQVSQMQDSDRYSIHFKFNHYEKGQTYYGLDTFCINNLMGDTTYMKDYISYDIMKYIGVDTPLMNYASVTVNGEEYGFFLALERYDKAFLDRVYDTSGGELYSVKIATGKRDDFINGNDNQNADEVQKQINDTQWQPPTNVGDGEQTAPGGGMGDMNNRGDGEQAAPGGGMGDMNNRGGGDLVYVDDEISSYSSIFDNAEFKSNSDQDKQRVITAIKNLNEGTNLEEYFNVDEILRYLAAHTVVVNLDSYSSSMAQNYYIYERDGKITILPWDYGLAFGGFQSGSADSVVNFPIDTPVSGVTMESRPLINMLLEVPEYKEKYHEYLQQIVDGYFESGIFAQTVMALDAKINSYVKEDSTSFTTYEAYEASIPVLIDLGTLRAQSIAGQLDGSIPSTSDGQNSDKDALIDASHINLSALGSMMGGGNRDREQDGDFSGDRRPGGFDDMGGNMFDRELPQQNIPVLPESGGELTEDAKAQLLDSGLMEEQIEQGSELTNQMAEGGFGGRDRPGDFSADDQREQGQFPGNIMPGGQNSTGNQSTMNPTANIVTLASLFLLVGTAVLFARKKKTY